VTPQSFAKLTSHIIGTGEGLRQRRREKPSSVGSPRFGTASRSCTRPVTRPSPPSRWPARSGGRYLGSRATFLSGRYRFAVRSEHGCLGEGALLPGRGAPVCTLIDLPTGAPNGSTSAEEDSGYTDYVTSVAGSCTPDPRDQTYPVACLYEREI